MISLNLHIRPVLPVDPVLPADHLGPRHDDVDDDGGRHQERGRGADYGQNIPIAFFAETVLR